MPEKRALIIGVGGQDGAFLAKHLLVNGYKVWGSTRGDTHGVFSSLAKLGVRENVTLVSIQPSDFRSVFFAVRNINPTEIYLLAGQSSVSLSFSEPVETINSIVEPVISVLEVMKIADNKDIKLFYAGSAEMYGDIGTRRANESTLADPVSPYGVAKASAYQLIRTYRDAYGLFATTGILYNHESELRPATYVTKKIVNGVLAIHSGVKSKLELGDIDVIRDWGYAGDYVVAMHRMLRLKRPDDFVIGTGRSYSLKDFVECAFNQMGLDWRECVVQNKSLLRAKEITQNYCDPTKANQQLNWKPTLQFQQLVQYLFERASSTKSSTN